MHDTHDMPPPIITRAAIQRLLSYPRCEYVAGTSTADAAPHQYCVHTAHSMVAARDLAPAFAWYWHERRLDFTMVCGLHAGIVARCIDIAPEPDRPGGDWVSGIS